MQPLFNETLLESVGEELEIVRFILPDRVITWRINPNRLFWLGIQVGTTLSLIIILILELRERRSKRKLSTDIPHGGEVSIAKCLAELEPNEIVEIVDNELISKIRHILGVPIKAAEPVIASASVVITAYAAQKATKVMLKLLDLPIKELGQVGQLVWYTKAAQIGVLKVAGGIGFATSTFAFFYKLYKLKAFVLGFSTHPIAVILFMFGSVSTGGAWYIGNHIDCTSIMKTLPMMRDYTTNEFKPYMENLSDGKTYMVMTDKKENVPPIAVQTKSENQNLVLKDSTITLNIEERHLSVQTDNSIKQGDSTEVRTEALKIRQELKARAEKRRTLKKTRIQEYSKFVTQHLEHHLDDKTNFQPSDKPVVEKSRRVVIDATANLIQ